MAGDAKNLDAGQAGTRGTLAGLPADVPKTAGQGATGGPGGNKRNDGKSGHDGYVIVSW